MIKVASYNMRKSIGTDRRRRPERTLQVLCEIGADIVALQEADKRFGARAAVLGGHLLPSIAPTRRFPSACARRAWGGMAMRC